MLESKGKPEAYGMAQQFLANQYVQNPDSPIGAELWLRWWREEWYAYNAGTYSRIGVDELKAQIVGFLHEQEMPVSAHYVTTMILVLTHLCLVASGQQLNAWLDGINGAQVITAANGNVSLSDRDPAGWPRLLPHTAKYFGMARLSYDYEPEAKCPLWCTFLADVMQDNEGCCALLQEWCGYLFRPDLNEHKFLLCVGEGANGKGTFSEVVEALAGEQNTTHVPLARFDNPFALYSTIGKRVNITNEAIGMIEEFGESQLKSFVAGDAMSFERKFLNPVDAKPTAKLMIATNALPRFGDKTWGTWRRIVLVPFNRTIMEHEQVKGLATELKTQLPGILNWALAGLDRLNRQGHFTIPDEHAALLEEYRRDADPARAFLMEHYAASSNGEHIGTGELYAAYQTWCKECGCQPMHERHFGRHVRRIFPNVERRRLGTRAQREYVYAGLSVSRVS